MFVSPVLSSSKVQTPQEYTNRARDEIQKKLNINSTSSSSLRHGSSPLKNVSNASDSSLSKVSSNESIDSTLSVSSDVRRHRKLFGLLKNRGSSQQQQQQQQQNRAQQESDQDVIMDDDLMAPTQQDDEPVDPLAIVHMQPLHPVPSITSTVSQQSRTSHQSLLSKSTVQESIFTHQGSILTNFTNVSSIASQPTPPSSQPNSKRLILDLDQALPKNFNDMYAPELLADPNLLIDGRPLFTKRALLDWDLNDLRSLLIVESLKPEWNGKLPLINTPQGFKFQYLPLTADDETFIQTLVESDIYKEAKFDINFRIQTAQYTLKTARSRHAMILQNSGLPTIYNNRLSKPEWRNVIENFLLNLAVEAQCRHDFKRQCQDLKKEKRKLQSQSQSPSQLQPSIIAPSFGGAKNSLLHKAILNDATSKHLPIEVKLTKDEKSLLWMKVQALVYKRIGLDWAPDRLIG